MKKRVLTGVRPTGKLHLGHYVGMLSNLLRLQEQYDMFVMVADLHMLTTKPEKKYVAEIPENTREVLLDYLAVGLDPSKVVFYQQSRVPEVTYLSTLFSMVIPVSYVERVPTLKEIIKDLNIQSPSLGLLSYPVLQAADILMVKADLVPVGKDQMAHVELTREIARRFNNLYGNVFPETEGLVGEIPTLIGTDGKAKMSKSLRNTINLSDSEEEVKEKVAKMYTDPARIHGTEPGEVENNPVFIYHDAFNTNKEEVSDLKMRYRQGTVKDVEVKERLAAAINTFLTPIRERRDLYEKDPSKLSSILEEGNKRARTEAASTLLEAQRQMGL